MTDPFGRTIDYLRVSITDRCDFRCVYCMAEDMTFLPRADLLTLEELDRLCSAFIAKGVRKLRLTGGEPLVRRNMMSLVRSLSRHLKTGALDELTLTTNGSQLARFAAELADCGVRRVNVSLDTLDPDEFRRITRWGDLERVLAGIDAARTAGLAVKINSVVLKGSNEDEIPSLMRWAHGLGMGLTLIEVMPLGEIGEGRIDQYVPLSLIRARLSANYTLTDLPDSTGGPAATSVSRRPAAGSASLLHSRTISANPAIGCGLPAPARFTPASATRTPPTCDARCAPPQTMPCSAPRSIRRSAQNPRATTSSSTAAITGRASAGT